MSYNAPDLLSGSTMMFDISNAMALREDIHKVFNDRKFVFVPKPGRWVAHFLMPTHNMGTRYHNTVVEVNTQVSVELLLVRFAWGIFLLVRGFLDVESRESYGSSSLLRISIQKLSRQSLE